MQASPSALHEAARANAKDLIEALAKDGVPLDEHDEVSLFAIDR